MNVLLLVVKDTLILSTLTGWQYGTSSKQVIYSRWRCP